MSASRGSKIASKSNEVHYKDWTIEAKIEDYVAKLKDKAGCDESASNDLVVHTMPDFRAVFSIICLYSVHFYSLVEARTHAKVSLPTVSLYSLVIIYVYMFFSDLYLNPAPSEYALAIAKDHSLMEFLNWCLTLPVPDYLHTYLKQFAHHPVNGNSSICFTPSAAGFSLCHDFGRFFPINIFTSMHDILCNTPSNSNINAVWLRLFNETLFTAQFSGTRNAQRTSIGNLFGVETLNHGANDNNYYSSRFYQIFNTVFNPVLLRATQARSAFSTIGLETLDAFNAVPNFYELVLQLTPYNVVELKVVLESVRDVFKGKVPCSKDLASFFTTSGSGILVHGYSQFAVPTWNAATHAVVSKDNIRAHTGDFAPRSVVQYAGFLHYKTATTPAYDQAMNSFPAARVTGTDHAADRNLETVLMRANEQATAPLPGPADFFTLARANASVPKVDVLTAYESDVELAYLALFLGLVIETEEIDATISVMPHPDVPIGDVNLHVFNSLVQLFHVRRAVRFTGATTPAVTHTRRHPVLNRNLEAAQDNKSAVLLHDATRIVVPRVLRTGTIRNVTTNTNFSAQAIPGLLTVDDVTWPAKFLRFIGFRQSNRQNSADADSSGTPVTSANNVMPGAIIMWSPYRVLGLPRSPARNAVRTTLPDIYMIANLRPFLGARIKLIRVNGLESALPQ